MNLLKQTALFSITLLMSCQLSTEQTDQENSSKKELPTAKKRKKASKLPLLTTENSEEILKEYARENPENIVSISTRLGAIVIRLYENTPIHRANFLMLCNRNYYNKTEFYRVIKDFMIQGGGTDNLQIKSAQRAIGKYRIPAEIHPNTYFHKKGAIAMAREYEGNPEKKSASYDFYIVVGRTMSESELNNLEKERKYPFTDLQRKTYTTIGGSPHLDGDHTVFGEVIEGIEVVEKIAQEEVSQEDHWPLKSIEITTTVKAD